MQRCGMGNGMVGRTLDQQFRLSRARYGVMSHTYAVCFAVSPAFFISLRDSQHTGDDYEDGVGDQWLGIGKGRNVWHYMDILYCLGIHSCLTTLRRGLVIFLSVSGRLNTGRKSRFQQQSNQSYFLVTCYAHYVRLAYFVLSRVHCLPIR